MNTNTATIGGDPECACCRTPIDIHTCTGFWEMVVPAGLRILCDECGLVWMDYPDGPGWEPL
jgi:hypothetical protein